MIDGLASASGWQIIIFTILTCHITLLGVTIYLHRAMAHRAIDLHPWVANFFRFWLWMNTGMVTREWVAIHRKHHAHCETEEDPHSPVVLGVKKVLFEGAELYQTASMKPEIMEKYGRGCPDDWLERNVYEPHRWLGIGLLFSFDLLMFGVWGITVVAVQLLCIPALAAGVINGIGHYWGYRNYECDDAATNVVPWGIIIVGEELHNNHHAYPSSAKFALRRFEFDLGWVYIRLLVLLGLAKVRRVAPKPSHDSAADIDLNTVKALISSRLHVMRDYAKTVVKPIHKAALLGAAEKQREILAAAQKPLLRAPTLLDAEARQRIVNGLKVDSNLDMVYQYRERLIGIWSMANASQDRLVQAFAQWCTEAENSGIGVLQDFAVNLRGYTLQKQNIAGV